MSTRLTYVPLEMAERLQDFIITRDEMVLDTVKIRARDFSTLLLLKVLYPLSAEPMTFTGLYVKSRIRMKRSFLNYLRLCLDYNFVTKKSMGQSTLYSITDKGTTMLNFFMQN